MSPRLGLLALLAVTLAGPSWAAPAPTPGATASRDAAYYSYAQYYLQHYPTRRLHDPYRFYNLYDYYRTRYGAQASADADPYYFYTYYDRHPWRQPATGSMLGSALRFWRKLPATASHGR